ncbi:helix-turn-helix domain-containing protein [Aeromicrobium sp. SMF47]|uniref:IclR family transcriptional regulator n=1 Tax=Aeromicrobium TaxID=2040 RepID=UPI00129E3170|nr:MULTISPECIES: IclR family transcriptional regulator [Aeromicrobium]MRJ77996.1 helix-turn-helix domain-containing protein [Aeromicrobium yanjiei]MRK02356.1 helix-turn-helix domain-containing protein [Aeromicrobium sp. S22]
MASTTSSRPSPESASGTESADRVADVLVSFTRSDRPLGVSQIARDLGLSKAVVHRILQSLASRSLVQVVPGDVRYALGPTAVGLGTKAWSQLDVRSLAAPTLRGLRDLTRETATLSVLVGNRRIYLDQYESPQEVKMVVEIGPQFPLHSGASSRSILAFLPPAFIDEVIAELVDVRPTTDVEEYRQGLDLVRTQGYATSNNERMTGAASIAAPFFDASGNVLGSISSSGPAARYAELADESHQEHVAEVLSAAHAITQLLQPARS